MDRKKAIPRPPPSPDSDDLPSSPPRSQPKLVRPIPTPTPPRPADSSEFTDADDDDDDDDDDSSGSGSSESGSSVEGSNVDGDSDSSDSTSDAPPLKQRNVGVNGSAKIGVFSSPPPEQKAKQNSKEKVEALKRGREGVSEDGPAVTKRKKDRSETGMEEQKSRVQGAVKEGSLQREKEKVAQAQSHDAGKEQPNKASKQKSEEKSEPQVQIPGKGNRLENGYEKKGSKSEKEGKSDQKGFKEENEGKSDKKAQKNSETDVVKERLSPLKPKKAQKNSESEVPKEPASPMKPKKPQIWLAKDEIALSSELLSLVKSGSEIPIMKADGFWATLHEQLQGKLEADWSKDQLCDKVKRMKTRYHTLEEKMKESDKPFKHRTNNDRVLFGLWSQVWGKGDDDNEADDDKEEQSKARAAHVAPIKESKFTQDRKEPDAHKTKQQKQETNETEDYTDDEGASEGNGATTMIDAKPQTGVEVFGDGNHKSLLDVALLPRVSGIHDQAEHKSSHSSSDIHKLLQDATRASLQEVQETSKRMLEEWQSKAMTVVESTVKAIADKCRFPQGMGLAGTGGFGLPSLNNWEHLDFEFSHGEHAFQQQWYELHLQELDLYSQRLQLIQQECRVKQEQLKLQLKKGK